MGGTERNLLARSEMWGSYKDAISYTVEYWLYEISQSVNVGLTTNERRKIEFNQKGSSAKEWLEYEYVAQRSNVKLSDDRSLSQVAPSDEQ